MIFSEVPVVGAFEVGLQPARDDRGYLARTFCAEEFASRGLNPRVVQCSTSFNPRRGTLRGLHFQRAPHGECKLVRCTRGRVYDVIVDLREESPSYARWYGSALSAEGPLLYVPEGCAHGFITLEDDSEVHYQISHAHVPSHADGVRWDDPALGISWPLPPTVMSERDRSYPDLRP